MSTMKMKAVLSGTTIYRKNTDIALFAFQPSGRAVKTVFRMYVDGEWGLYDIEPEWTAVGMGCAVYSEKEGTVVVASNPDGELWEVRTASGEEQEASIPGDYSELTRLRGIEKAIWVCGMGRVVLRREADGSWTDLSAADPSVDEGVIGFTDIAGVARDEIVAVGWKGEIWLRRRNRWESQDSGTTGNLNAVSVGPDGQIVAVGDGGVIVVGRRNQWTVLDNIEKVNLQGVCHFGKETFVCSDFDIYRLEKEELAFETRFVEGDEPETCMNLLANEVSVFSQGASDIFRFADGVWKRVF